MLQLRTHHGGWLPDVPDFQDFQFVPKAAPTAVLPTVQDFRPLLQPIDDQNGYGSCVAHSTQAALRFEHMRQGLGDTQFSRAFIYYMARTIDGSVHEDSGTSNRAGMKSVAKYGACPETEWLYTESHIYKRPTTLVRRDALQDKVLKYYRLSSTSLDLQRACLQEYPFVFGVSVFESFESPTASATGVIPMPKKGEQLLGGHSMLAVGYDDTNQWFIIRNSWGPDWGDSGYGYLPYSYMTNRGLASDFWVLQLAQ